MPDEHWLLSGNLVSFLFLASDAAVLWGQTGEYIQAWTREGYRYPVCYLKFSVSVFGIRILSLLQRCLKTDCQTNSDLNNVVCGLMKKHWWNFESEHKVNIASASLHLLCIFSISTLFLLVLQIRDVYPRSRIRIITIPVSEFSLSQTKKIPGPGST